MQADFIALQTFKMSRDLSDMEWNISEVVAPGLSGPRAVAVPATVPIPEGSAGDILDLPPMVYHGSRPEPVGLLDYDSDGTSESGEDSDGESDDETEEAEVDDNETPVTDSADWEEIKETVEFKIEEFSQRLVGINHPLDSTAPPLAFLGLIFDDTFFQHLVDETNRYAHQCLGARVATVASVSGSPDEDAPRPIDNSWTDTTLPEIKAYIGMNILMGLRGHSDLTDIWSSRPCLHDSYLSKVMTRDRFRALSNHFHIVDNTTVERDYKKPGYDPMHKVRPMIDLFNTRAADVYKPTQHLSVDEAMIPFKGRHPSRQYMPKKPVKWGFKVWVCAEAGSGYALQLEVYEGKARSQERIDRRSKHGLGFDVVEHLTRQYQGYYHVVCIDRFFSSVTLAEHLLQQKTYVMSTVMMNRKGLPAAAKKLRLKKYQPLHQYRKGDLLLTVFFDKRQISHLSTGCLPGLSDSGVKPIVNVAYNKHMGGVDLCDQHNSYYKVGRKTVKWYKYIVWYLINLAISNAYVAYKASRPPPIVTDAAAEAQPRGVKTHKEFRLDVIEQLVGTFSRHATYKRSRSSSSQVLMEPLAALTHLPVEVGQRLCQYCSKKGGKKRPKTGCKECDVSLCLGLSGCFQRYHAERCGISLD